MARSRMPSGLATARAAALVMLSIPIAYVDAQTNATSAAADADVPLVDALEHDLRNVPWYKETEAALTLLIVIWIFLLMLWSKRVRHNLAMMPDKGITGLELGASAAAASPRMLKAGAVAGLHVVQDGAHVVKEGVVEGVERSAHVVKHGVGLGAHAVAGGVEKGAHVVKHGMEKGAHVIHHHAKQHVDDVMDGAAAPIKESDCHENMKVKIHAITDLLHTAYTELPIPWMVVWISGVLIIAGLAFTILVWLPGAFGPPILMWTVFIIRIGVPVEEDEEGEDEKDTRSNPMHEDMMRSGDSGDLEDGTRMDDACTYAAMMEKAREAFAGADQDGNGALDDSEIHALALSLGVPDNELLEKSIGQMDTDHNGQISQEEFLEWWKTQETHNWHDGIEDDKSGLFKRLNSKTVLGGAVGNVMGLGVGAVAATGRAMSNPLGKSGDFTSDVHAATRHIKRTKSTLGGDATKSKDLSMSKRKGSKMFGSSDRQKSRDDMNESLTDSYDGQ